MVASTLLRTLNKEIKDIFRPEFSWYFPVISILKWCCFLAPMVRGTDLNGTGYRKFRYLVLPCGTIDILSVLPLWYVVHFA